MDQLQDKAGIDARRLRVAADRVSDGLDLGNADSGVYLASQFIGLFDKRLGGDVQRVGTAAIQVARIAKGLRDAQALQGSIGSAVGMGAMTGGVGFALVAVSAMSSMSSDGPSADELILEQLGAIRQQLIDLQKHIDERFDRVDAALEQIYTEMVAGFDLVERQLKGIERTQDRIEASIIRQDGRLNALEERVISAIVDLKDANSALLLAPCKRWRETTVVVDMPVKTFVESC